MEKKRNVLKIKHIMMAVTIVGVPMESQCALVKDALDLMEKSYHEFHHQLIFGSHRNAMIFKSVIQFEYN